MIDVELSGLRTRSYSCTFLENRKVGVVNYCMLIGQIAYAGVCKLLSREEPFSILPLPHKQHTTSRTIGYTDSIWAGGAAFVSTLASMITREKSRTST